MGRFDFLTNLGLTEEDLIELHDECIHIDQLAKDLEVSKKTLTKRLKGLLDKTEIKYKPRKLYKKHSAFAQWRRKHPDVILPSSVPEIQEITGLSRYTIHHYLYRRLEEYHKFVKDNFNLFLKSHRQKSLLVFDQTKFPIKALKRTGLTINKFSLTMTVTFQLKNHIIKRITVSESEFRDIINNIKTKGE